MYSRLIRPCLTLALASCLIITAACGPSTLTKLHDTLNKTAKALNAAAKTNRDFYEQSVYGAVGSTKAIDLRQKAATVIHDSNEKLILALNLAQNLTAATFEQGKIAVLQSLADAAAGLNTGNTRMDLVLQSVATLITQAVALIQIFKASQLQYVLPEIRTWTIAEVSV